MTSDDYILLADQVHQQQIRLAMAERQLRSMAYRAAQGERTVISHDGAVAKVIRGYADDLSELVTRLHDFARALARRARDIG